MRLLLPALALMTVSPALAQPILTTAQFPIVGFSYSAAVTTSNAPAPGASGANVTWDFSTANFGSTTTATYTACPGGPNCATYPNATMVATDGSGNSSYISATANASQIYGSRLGGTDIVYSDPEDYQRAPFTYNNTYTDAFSATYTSNGVTFYRMGTTTALADGWGTLKTPAGTFANTLRVKRTSTYRDSIASFGVVFNITQITYLWYNPGVREFLMTHSALTTTPAGTTSGNTVTTAAYRTNVAASVVEVADGTVPAVSPNPARDFLSVRWADYANGTATLTDALGRTVARATGRGGLQLAVGHLPRGLYMLRTERADGSIHTDKVLLQ